MFDTSRKSAGRDYTITVAWLAIAVIFIPMLALAVHPRYVSLGLAFIGSVACVVMSWISWTKSSKASIPTLTSPPRRDK